MNAAFEVNVLAEPAAISDATEKISDFLRSGGVDLRTVHHVALAVEEILTNLATHGNCAGAPAMIRIVIEPDRVRTEITDTGPYFDLREAPDPDLAGGSAERAIGGLGLYLVRRFASNIEYVRRDGTNLTTFAIARGAI